MNAGLKKLNIAVMLGGPSAEREVSLRSGAGVAKALRSLGPQVSEVDPRNEKWKLPKATDVVFLALHGTYGEDGTVQRRLAEVGITYKAGAPARPCAHLVLSPHQCVRSRLSSGRRSSRCAEARPPGFKRRPGIRRAC